jgi:membrane protein
MSVPTAPPTTPTATPPAIPGEPIDPPAKATPKKIRELADRPGAVGAVVGVGYRTMLRFTIAKVPLLAAGTTYYLFFSIFALLAFGYGLAATLGNEQLSAYLTEAVGEAFPGLLGDDSLDPDTLRAAGQTASALGLIGLLYGGVGGVSAVNQSIHLVFGAPKDSRNFVVSKARLLAWLLPLAVLVLLSFVASTVTSTFASTVFEMIGFTWTGPSVLLRLATTVVTLGLNFALVYLLLSHFGGIRPPCRARVFGAAFGAVAIEILKGAMTLILSFALNKPQYGALTAPIGILLVLYLQSMAVYVSASLTAGFADRETPLEQLEVATSAAGAPTTAD